MAFLLGRLTIIRMILAGSLMFLMIRVGYLSLYMGDTAEIALAFKNTGYSIACAEIRDSVSCFEADLKLPLLLVIGGEKRGISSKLSALRDVNVRIPYAREFLGSLSTSSAVSILAYEVVRQNPTMSKVN